MVVPWPELRFLRRALWVRLDIGPLALTFQSQGCRFGSRAFERRASVAGTRQAEVEALVGFFFLPDSCKPVLQGVSSFAADGATTVRIRSSAVAGDVLHIQLG